MGLECAVGALTGSKRGGVEAARKENDRTERGVS